MTHDRHGIGTVMPLARLTAGLLLHALLTTPAQAITPIPTLTWTPSSTPTASPTVTPTATPLLLADANCDGASTAADFVAIVIVSTDGTRFPDCAGANSFRDRPLTDQDFLPLLHDIFGTLFPKWTPTPSASPTITGTPTRTPSPSPTPRVTASRTPSLTPPPSASPSFSPTPTATTTNTPSATPTGTRTPTPTRTSTTTPTRTPTPTWTPTPTPTPTGLAYQLSGNWAANWTNQICYLNGYPFASLQDTTYSVTALNGWLNIQVVGGPPLGGNLQLDANNSVAFTYSAFDPQNACPITGALEQYVFEYTFTFNTDGTGTASAHWTYGYNTNCAVCAVDDTATLQRVAGPP